MQLHSKLATKALITAICLVATGLQAQTNYTFTAPGFFFNVSGPGVDNSTPDPTPNLVAGNTYTFTANLEPGEFSLVILTNPTQVSSEYTGATPQNISSGIIPDAAKKNEQWALEGKNEATCFFWIHKDAPAAVAESLRLLSYTGIVTRLDSGIVATRREIGTRFALNFLLSTIAVVTTFPFYEWSW
jgi:hypothetical protein